MNPRLGLPLLVWLLAMGLGMAWLATRLEVTHDLSVFLPDGSSREEQLLLDELQGGQSAQLILLAIGGGDAAQRARASEQLAAALRGSSLIAEVANGAHAPALGPGDRLAAYRFLLSPRVEPALFETGPLHQSLQQRLQDLSDGLPLVDKRWLAHDPVGLVPSLLEAWQGKGPARTHGVWSDPAGEQALLMVHSTVAGFDLARQQAVIDAIDAAFASLEDAARLSLRMSGPAVFAVQSRETIREESRRLSLWASIAVALILLLAYRSWTAALLSAAPLVTALVAGLGVTALATGPVHGIALAFGIVLLGLTLDYPLHLFSHHRAGASLTVTARSIAPAMTISALTTAMAFAVLALGDFRGLVQLGVMTATGLLAAAITTLWVLPAMTGTFTRHVAAMPEGLARVLAAQTGGSPVRPWLLAGLSALAVLYSLAMPEPWEDDLGALSPVPSVDRQHDQALRQALGAPDVRHLLLVRGDDREGALRHSEAIVPLLDGLVGQGLIQGYDLAARYLPSQATQEARRAALPSPEALEAALARAGEGMPFRPGLFAPFLKDVEQARQLSPLTGEDLAGTPLGARVGSLLRQDVQGWTALVVLRGVGDPARLAVEMQQSLPAFARALDLKLDTEAMVVRFRVETLATSLLAGAGILLALLIWLRSPVALIRAIIPVLAALALTVAALLALGEALTLFHLVSLLLVLGIAVDYVVFLQSHGRDAPSLARTMHALLACVASTTAVFALLAGSSIPVLHAIGLTVALGVPLALGAALLMGTGARALNRP